MATKKAPEDAALKEMSSNIQIESKINDGDIEMGDDQSSDFTDGKDEEKKVMLALMVNGTSTNHPVQFHTSLSLTARYNRNQTKFHSSRACGSAFRFKIHA